MQWNFLWYQRKMFFSTFLLTNQRFPLLSPKAAWVPEPRQAVHRFYQFLQIPHSNKSLGLCCIESLCDKAELTSLIIVKVTEKKLYNSYLFCRGCFVCIFLLYCLVWVWVSSFFPFFWQNFSVILKEDLIPGNVSKWVKIAVCNECKKGKHGFNYFCFS